MECKGSQMHSSKSACVYVGYMHVSDRLSVTCRAAFILCTN